MVELVCLAPLHQYETRYCPLFAAQAPAWSDRRAAFCCQGSARGRLLQDWPCIDATASMNRHVAEIHNIPKHTDCKLYCCTGLCIFGLGMLSIVAWSQTHTSIGGAKAVHSHLWCCEHLPADAANHICLLSPLGRSKSSNAVNQTILKVQQHCADVAVAYLIMEGKADGQSLYSRVMTLAPAGLSSGMCQCFLHNVPSDSRGTVPSPSVCCTPPFKLCLSISSVDLSCSHVECMLGYCKQTQLSSRQWRQQSLACFWRQGAG